MGLELELGAGAAHTLETWSSSNYPLATPLLQGRAAVDFGEHWSIGGSFLAVVGGEAPNAAGCCNVTTGHSAFEAIAAIASLRLHSVKPTQFWVEGGVGIGHLISLQTDDSFEHPPLRGRGGGAVQVAGGLRHFFTPTFALGAQASWLLWTRVEQAPAVCEFCSSKGSGATSSAILFLLTATFALLR